VKRRLSEEEESKEPKAVPPPPPSPKPAQTQNQQLPPPPSPYGEPRSLLSEFLRSIGTGEEGKKITLPEALLVSSYVQSMAFQNFMQYQIHQLNANRTNQQVPKSLLDKLSMLESEIKALREEKKRKEIEELISSKIKPLNETISKLSEALESLKKKPTTESESEVKSILKEVRDLLTKKDLADMIEKLKDTVESLPEKMGEKAVSGTGIDQVTKLLQSLSTIKKSIEDLTGKSTVPPEGVDWKSVFIQEFADVIKTALPKLAGTEEKQVSEISLQDVIDQKVLEYAINTQIYGDGIIRYDKCAKVLGLTPEQVYESIKRLEAKGRLRTFIPKKTEEKKPVKEEKKEEKKVEKKKGESKGEKTKEKGAEWESYLETKRSS